MNLDNLSAQEKQLALQILKEYHDKGTLNKYNELIYSDYKEIPVDIITFLKDPNLMGNAWTKPDGSFALYPFWQDKLKKLFPDNISTAVNNFIESGARGLGKSEVAAGAIIPYLIYRILCMKNPRDFYGLKITEKICFPLMNITKTLAEEIALDKFQKGIQLSPWFMSKGTMTTYNNSPFWIPPDPVEIIIGSQSSHVIGQPIFAAFFDEVSFQRNQNIDKQKAKAIDMIDTALGGMKTRFIKNGKNPTLMILASSKRSEKSFLEEHMKTKINSEKDNVLIIDSPVWEVKPKGTYNEKTFKVGLGNKFLPSIMLPDDINIDDYIERGYKIIDVPIDFKPNFTDDIERALCDFAGISSTEISKYISGQAVTDVINKNLSNPFVKDILEIGNAKEDKDQYYDYFDLSKVNESLKHKPLYIHMDLSVSGDKTGIAGVWVKGKKPSVDALDQSNDLFYSLAFSVSIKAPKGRQISFEKNKNFIYWLKEQGFNIKGISTDSFQSVETGQVLTAKGYPYSQISVDRVDPSTHICKPYQYLKNTIYEQRFEMYYSKLLVQEITDLERNINTGKVDHPENGSKDAIDAVTGAMYNASQNAEQFAYDHGESLQSTIDANFDSLEMNKEQITIDFESELAKIMTQGFINNNQDVLTEQSNQGYYGDFFV